MYTSLPLQNIPDKAETKISGPTPRTACSKPREKPHLQTIVAQRYPKEVSHIFLMNNTATSAYTVKE